MPQPRTGWPPLLVLFPGRRPHMHSGRCERPTSWKSPRSTTGPMDGDLGSHLAASSRRFYSSARMLTVTVVSIGGSPWDLSITTMPSFRHGICEISLADSCSSGRFARARSTRKTMPSTQRAIAAVSPTAKSAGVSIMTSSYSASSLSISATKLLDAISSAGLGGIGPLVRMDGDSCRDARDPRAAFSSVLPVSTEDTPS